MSIPVAILGVTGYLGSELKKLLSLREDVKIVYEVSRFPEEEDEIDELKGAQVVFLALPHQESMKLVPGILNLTGKVIDLSGAYRLKNPSEYPVWYGFKHNYPSLLKGAVYGLPEKNREQIRGAKLVANGGCYETVIILCLLPLAKEGLITSKMIVVDAISGYTGAGKKAEIPKTIVSYKVGRKHQHIPAIEQELNICGKLLFAPSIAPFPRGIYATIRLQAKEDLTLEKIQDLYRDYYDKEPFVSIKEEINSDEVIKKNFCDIAVEKEGDVVKIYGVLDNLRKGGSSQAIQNFNIMCGLPETKGLISRQL